MYEPAILVVGTRGRSLAGFQGLLPGSVSKYCLQHSPVPVIVVRPSSKRDKARTKRALDPNRHAYKDLLEKSGNSGHMLEADPRNHHAEDSRHASDDEAAAVAAAIGYKPVTGTPLAQSQSTSTIVGSDAVDAEDPDVAAALMKSPELQNLESPEISDESTSSDEEGGVPTTAKPTTEEPTSGLGLQSVEPPAETPVAPSAASTAAASNASSEETAAGVREV